ncbi:uncharacterized protein LOC144096773 isoform X2 [Amblyomma americanum]
MPSSPVTDEKIVICVGFCKAASGARRTCPLIRHSSLGGLGDAASADVGIQCLENKEFTMGKEHLNLPVLVGLLWMASSTEGSDTVLLYPTIMMPRNITMGFGTFVNFRCELNITAGSASEVFWLLGGARIPNDHRRHSKLEVPAEGRYVSHLEVRDLQAVDAGRYTCDATARLNNLNLVLVIPDSVYLSVADYRAAHWGEPCDGLKGAETCVDANTGCFKDRPPERITATGWSCQCVEGFPIHSPALRRCQRGSKLGSPCIEDGQCRWFTQFSVCQRGVCQCADAYTASRGGTECSPVIREGRQCSMDWECEPSGMECIERSCRHKVEVFKGLGQLKAFEYNMKLKPGAAGVVVPARRVPVALQDKVEAELQRMEEQAVLKKRSPEARPPFWLCSPSSPSAY